VDGNGCPLDSDGDGVADHIDKCPGTMRGVRVNAQGCEPDTDEDGVLDRNDNCPNTTRGVQVDAVGCEIKEAIDLPGVNFESNSDRLLPGAENVLRQAAESLRRNPTIKVEVAGHTDSDGAAEYNESLSARRAQTVRDYLVSQGVSPARMTTRGYGEMQPVADNSSADGKSRNRRVVLRITER
jgi:OOP family OmpA-OmpF porin